MKTMDRGIRNTLLGVLGTVVVAFVGAWVQLNSRISILEVQVNTIICYIMRITGNRRMI